MAQQAPKVAKCLEALERHGLLMLQDARLPSVTTTVAGGPVKGSWWGHARGHAIFNTAEALENHADVAVARIIDRKVTYLHRRLWPALLAVGRSREAWQTRSLPPGGRRLLRAVEGAGSLRTDRAAVKWRTPPREVGNAARELERRLLVYAEEVHTKSGAHAKELTAWAVWARREGLSPGGLGPADGRALFEETLAPMEVEFGADARLPWEEGVRRRVRSRP